MRTTIDIDPKLLAEAEKLTGEKSPSKTVNAALKELVRLKKMDSLLALRGKLDLNLDDWYEFRHAERT